MGVAHGLKYIKLHFYFGEIKREIERYRYTHEVTKTERDRERECV